MKWQHIGLQGEEFPVRMFQRSGNNTGLEGKEIPAIMFQRSGSGIREKKKKKTFLLVIF